MSSNPYADVGNHVTGDRFIGREKEIRLIQARIFGERSFGSMAVVGLPRIGKSSLVSEVIGRARSEHAGHIVVRVDVGAFGSMEDLVEALLQQVVDAIRHRELSTDLFEARVQRALGPARGGINLHGVNGVFNAVRQISLRVICILDEFDAGRRLFVGSPWFFNWLRDLCSNPDHRTAIVLITKRRLQHITETAGYGSNYWSNVLLTCPVRSFGPSEVTTFFSKLSKDGVRLDEGQRQQVQRFCGSHPFLMDTFAFRAWERVAAGERLDSDWIESTCSRFVQDYFQQVVSVLDEKPLVPRLRQALIGQSGADVSATDVEIMEDYGLARWDRSEGIRAFSPAFASYLRRPETVIDAGGLESGENGLAENPGVEDDQRPDDVPASHDEDQASRKQAPLFAWLHISDMHFGYPDSEGRWDQQMVVDALVRDVKKLVREKRVPKPHAIFVTGDIAFSGGGKTTSSDQAGQYEVAQRWLQALSHEIGLSTKDIFVVPGNHDVDRNVDTDDDTRRLMVALRNDWSAKDTLDYSLDREGDATRLRDRQSQYLDFAREMAPGCDRPWWVHERPVTDGRAVVVVGLNTALLARDDLDRGKLRVGKRQLAETIKAMPNHDTLVLVLSHHPIVDGWLADQGEVSAWVKRNAHVHICGHVHEFESESSWSGAGGDFLRIVAGAAHAGSGNGPVGHGYNFGAAYHDKGDRLSVRVWPRKWVSRKAEFRTDQEGVPDGQDHALHPLTLKR